ncbi:putative symporter [Streptomyces sp. MA5143a]|nr:putative symporter [Streptomyces sp. MA5143a]
MRYPAAGLGLLAGFVAGAVVMVAVSLFTAPKPEEELQGLVYGTRSPGMEEPPAEGGDAWYRRPALLGWGVVVLAAACYIPCSF